MFVLCVLNGWWVLRNYTPSTLTHDTQAAFLFGMILSDSISILFNVFFIFFCPNTDLFSEQACMFISMLSVTYLVCFRGELKQHILVSLTVKICMSVISVNFSFFQLLFSLLCRLQDLFQSQS